MASGTTEFRALVAREDGTRFEQLSEADLPDGDVTVDVRYSSLNYKDGLAVTGKSKIARRFAMVCGIDLAGTVAESTSPRWQRGDEVVVTGWGLSETHPGGYTQRQRVRSEWLVRRPEALSLARTMAVGTAGLTSMLCVLALEDAGISEGDVLVTGAAGGVGSVAVAILAQRGYRVTAATGRPQTHDYLRDLGATDFVDRAELAEASKRPLERQRWHGAVDTVGSTTLASVLKRIHYRGAVAACGLAGGADLPGSVMPFILRGVRLLGVDSVQCPAPIRTTAWERLATDLPLDKLDAVTRHHPFDDVPRLAEEILAGQTPGRVVIEIN
ncbi:MAG TPA: MDR family oxidoreductase [Amycolatopsis sp.]|nr:MDR family oxidoreductase [Amycolatopsis sp.]